MRLLWLFIRTLLPGPDKWEKPAQGSASCNLTAVPPYLAPRLQLLQVEAPNKSRNLSIKLLTPSSDQLIRPFLCNHQKYIEATDQGSKL